MVKNPTAMQETQVWSLGQEYLLEKGTKTHFSILAWRIPWTEEPGRLQFTGSQRVRHDWATEPHMYRRRKSFCLHLRIQQSRTCDWCIKRQFYRRPSLKVFWLVACRTWYEGSLKADSKVKATNTVLCWLFGTLVIGLGFKVKVHSPKEP